MMMRLRMMRFTAIAVASVAIVAAAEEGNLRSGKLLHEMKADDAPEMKDAVGFARLLNGKESFDADSAAAMMTIADEATDLEEEGSSFHHAVDSQHRMVTDGTDPATLAYNSVVAVTGQIPYVGFLVQVLVQTFWPNDTTDYMAEIATLVDTKIQYDNLFDAGQSLKDDTFWLGTKLSAYYETVTEDGWTDSQREDKLSKVVEEARRMQIYLHLGKKGGSWDLTNLDMPKMEEFKEHHFYLIGFVVNFALMHLAILKERCLFGKDFYSKDETDEWCGMGDATHDPGLLAYYFIYDEFFEWLNLQWHVWRKDIMPITSCKSGSECTCLLHQGGCSCKGTAYLKDEHLIERRSEIKFEEGALDYDCSVDEYVDLAKQEAQVEKDEWFEGALTEWNRIMEPVSNLKTIACTYTLDANTKTNLCPPVYGDWCGVANEGKECPTQLGLTCNQYVNKCDLNDAGGASALCNHDGHCEDSAYSVCADTNVAACASDDSFCQATCQLPAGGNCGFSFLGVPRCVSDVCEGSLFKGYTCAEGSNYKSMAAFETCENTDECQDGLTCNRYVNKCHGRKPGGMLGLCNEDSECEDLYGGGWTVCSGGACKRDTGGYCKNTNFNYYCASGECDASISRCT